MSSAMPSKRNPYYSLEVADAVVTAGAEATNVRRVTVQLVDRKRRNLAIGSIVDVFLSDAATGLGLAAAAPSGGVAIGTKGKILNATVAGKLLKCQTDAAGALELDVTEAGVKTFYVCVMLPNGTWSTPFALAFA